MEEGDSVDELWIKDGIWALHTSSVHPLHTYSCSLPFSLSFLLPTVESSLPLSVPLFFKAETAMSYCTCPGVPGHRKKQNSPLKNFSIEGSVCDGDGDCRVIRLYDSLGEHIPGRRFTLKTSVDPIKESTETLPPRSLL